MQEILLKCPIRNSGFTKIQLFKVEYFYSHTVYMTKSFLIRTIIVKGPGSKKDYSQQQLQNLLCKVSLVLVLAIFCRMRIKNSFL